MAHEGANQFNWTPLITSFVKASGNFLRLEIQTAGIGFCVSVAVIDENSSVVVLFEFQVLDFHGVMFSRPLIAKPMQTVKKTVLVRALGSWVPRTPELHSSSISWFVNERERLGRFPFPDFLISRATPSRTSRDEENSLSFRIDH